MAVIDDERRRQAAVETLERAGMADRELATFEGEEGVQQVDAEGVHSGGVKDVLRGRQRWTAEGHHLRRYQAEIGGGHHVVDVCVLGRRQRDAVVQILRTSGGNFINYRAGTHAPGSELGLSIVQRIVDLQSELGSCCLATSACGKEGGSVVSVARPEAMFELVNRQDVQPSLRRQVNGCDGHWNRSRPQHDAHRLRTPDV